ncbi:hypothetical protein C900_02585 [Fulvivirga imtechensis AK7]|uniref:Uncharacterized protein n=1 Tax=Fulvivirga imtechensis AK7 TaxID=1237149 RepID=L8JWC3_9BACT|nr:hypothetical protein [Fulvivirga imtechensis]ELR71522.1 hypothetical protein C900_02585 [Fulvivirga imtechensis AK7]
MFDGSDFPKSLNEELFNSWLENGRQSNLGYHYLLVLWDEFEYDYQPAYVESRDELDKYIKNSNLSSRESLVFGVQGNLKTHPLT